MSDPIESTDRNCLFGNSKGTRPIGTRQRYLPTFLQLDHTDYSQCACTKCQANTELNQTLRTKYDGLKKDGQGVWPDFDDVQRLLCPPRVLGYALDKKLWVSMLVDNVKE